jgi:hypothetical protein
MITEDALERSRITLSSTLSLSEDARTSNLSFPLSIEIDENVTPPNAERAINRTSRGSKSD